MLICLKRFIFLLYVQYNFKLFRLLRNLKIRIERFRIENIIICLFAEKEQKNALE